MNSEQWTSLIRTVLSIVLGPASYIVAKGILTPEQANQLIPAIVPLVMVVGAAAIGKWGIGSHSAPAIVAAVNSDSVPGVKVVSESSPSPAVAVTDTGAVKTIPVTGKP
jgi:hypothetical protein